MRFDLLNKIKKLLGVTPETLHVPRIYIEHSDQLHYHVSCYSIQHNQPRAQIIPLDQKLLHEAGIYTHADTASPDLTRFLVPLLQAHQGWAVFCENDIIWDVDVKELFSVCDDRYAVMVVKHDHEKFRNKQTRNDVFPAAHQRQDWSSVILWNCGHPSNQILNPELIRPDMADWLHRFGWLRDREIGTLDARWNWLVGWQPRQASRVVTFAVESEEARAALINERGYFYDKEQRRFLVSDQEWEEASRVTSMKSWKLKYGKNSVTDFQVVVTKKDQNRPFVLHYTRSKPWNPDHTDSTFDGVWERYMKQYQLRDTCFTAIVRARDQNSLNIEKSYREVALKIFQETCDGRSIVHAHQNNDDPSKSTIWDYKRFIKRTQTMLMSTDYPAVVVAAAPNSQVVHAKRFQQEKGSIPGPYVIRGIASKQLMEFAEDTGQDYYFIETGYFGNYTSEYNPGAKKIFHRLVKNNMQQEYVLDVPDDRWRMLEQVDARLRWPGWKRNGRNILLVAPSEKPCQFYNINKDQWIEDTIRTIKKHTDRPVVIREKLSRGHRTENSIYDAFDNDVFCVVTYNSIAAVEAVAYGIPAFALAPTAAQAVTLDNLTLIDTPWYPDQDFVRKWTHSLAYGQFHVDELANGTALTTILAHDDYNRLSL